jgi:drug/metabolite transporter (DMT)-like permease
LSILKPLLGISLKILSALAFTLMSSVVKTLSVRYPVGQLIFCRSFFALIPLMIWLSFQGPILANLRTSRFGSHLRRGLIGACGMVCGFLSLGSLPLPDAVAIGYASPLLAVVLAAVVLKETVRIYRWSAVAVGFVGVLIMLSPHLNLSTLAAVASGGAATGAAFGLVGALCSAWAMTEVRRLTRSETTGAIVFYFTALSSCLGLMTAALGWIMPMGLWDASLIVLMGILGGIGQILLTVSYRHGDASLVAPFEYTSMIWAVALGWMLFGDMPQQVVLIGAGVVIAAGIFVIWREKQLGMLRPENREAGPSMAK